MPALTAATKKLLRLLHGAPPFQLSARAAYEAVALSNLGLALLWSAQMDEAEPHLLAARGAAADAGLDLTLVNTLGSLGMLELERGQLRAARAMIRTCGWSSAR